tara:strand:- start:626 stop:1408 length:783 start_codon:yes stop_codon:yes gene_type:complete
MKNMSTKTTALSLILGAILITVFNSLIPVNAANPFSFSFDPSVSSEVIKATMGNQVTLRISTMLLTISTLLIPLGLLGIVRMTEKEDTKSFTNWGLLLSVIAITVWALTSGANLAFAGVISGITSATKQLAEAQGALAGATASNNMALVAQMTGAIAGINMGIMSLNISAGVINAIGIATHQIATMIFLIANVFLGLGMNQSKNLNSLLPKLLIGIGILGFITVIIYPLSSNPGYGLGGIILTLIALVWLLIGIRILRIR